MKPLVWSCLLALANPGCATKECHIGGVTRMVVPADEECPSVAAAQAKTDAENLASGEADETVVSFTQMWTHPAGTMCWYEMDLDPPCLEESRASIRFTEPSAISCEGDVWLYGVLLSADADECSATLERNTLVLPFVAADDYPAQNECSYETTRTEICANIGNVPGGGLK